ncbi:hypothetical protein EMIT0324P_110123 [Pseudomonas chlororaphis]
MTMGRRSKSLLRLLDFSRASLAPTEDSHHASVEARLARDAFQWLTCLMAIRLFSAERFPPRHIRPFLKPAKSGDHRARRLVLARLSVFNLNARSS